MKEQLALLPALLAAHVELALTALLLGALISIPLGIWLMRYPRAQAFVLSVAGTIQTIPALALLAIMVPGLAWLGQLLQQHFAITLSSIGYLPALLALFLYSIFPMLRNTVTGLSGVDAALVQAARGVGMTRRQRLWRVELPQALPVIVGGVRTAMVWVVGMTVLSTPVGAASLGNYIFSGLQTRNYNAVWVGCAAAAALALMLDWLIRSVELGLQNLQRWRFRLALLCLVGLYGFVLQASYHRLASTPTQGVIRIGAKSFTEQYILAEILAAQLHARTGRPTEIVPSLGSSMAFAALQDGAIDTYVDYSGSLWTNIMQQKASLPPPREVLLAQVAGYVEHTAHATVAARLGFSNAYTFAVQRPLAQQAHLHDLADLAAYQPPLRIAGDYEIFTRREYQQVRASYGLHFAEERAMDPSLMYRAILDHSVDVVAAYSSDGRLQAYNLVLLADTQQIFPPYDALILAGKHLQQDSVAMQALHDLQASMPLALMQQLNNAVDAQHHAPAQVAQQFMHRQASH